MDARARARERDPAALAPGAPQPPRPAGFAPIAHLQRRIGNRAVGQVLAAREKGPDDTLVEGDKGDEVRMVQMHLNQLDEVPTPLEADGVFGSRTAKAVRQFKLAHGDLRPKASVTPADRAAILAATAEPQETRAIMQKIATLGNEAYARRDYARAVDYLERAEQLSEGKDSAVNVYNRAQALRALGGRDEEAAKLLERYLQMGRNKRTEDARAQLADLRGPRRTGDREADKAAARPFFEEGTRLYAQKKYGHAYGQLTKAARLLPDHTGILWNRAQCLRLMGGRRRDAIALFMEYLASGEKSRAAEAEAHIAELRGPERTGDADADTAAARGLSDRAARLYAEGRYLQAADELEKAQQLSERPQILFNRAQALRRAGGRREDAIALYRRYLELGGGARREEAERFLALLEELGAAP